MIFKKISFYPHKKKTCKQSMPTSFFNAIKSVIFYFTTIHLPSRFEPIRLMTFLFCKDANVLSIVLFVKPIFSANSSDVYVESSISKATTFFSVLFKPTFKPTFYLASI